jgi:hypothetical protein
MQAATKAFNWKQNNQITQSTDKNIMMKSPLNEEQFITFTTDYFYVIINPRPHPHTGHIMLRDLLTQKFVH